MQLNDFQAACAKTAVYPGRCTQAGLDYALFGLCGEAGEVAGKRSKQMRDGERGPDNKEIIKELDDCLWFIAEAYSNVNESMESAGARLLAKLASRQQRGVLGGSGDNR